MSIIEKLKIEKVNQITYYECFFRNLVSLVSSYTNPSIITDSIWYLLTNTIPKNINYKIYNEFSLLPEHKNSYIENETNKIFLNKKNKNKNKYEHMILYFMSDGSVAINEPYKQTPTVLSPKEISLGTVFKNKENIEYRIPDIHFVLQGWFYNRTTSEYYNIFENILKLFFGQTENLLVNFRKKDVFDATSYSVFNINDIETPYWNLKRNYRHLINVAYLITYIIHENKKCAELLFKTSSDSLLVIIDDIFSLFTPSDHNSITLMFNSLIESNIVTELKQVILTK